MINGQIDWLTLIFYVVGGLGIFLYGIHKMGDSLKLLAGHRLKLLIEKTTNTPLKGIFIGIFVTVLLQTSSGTTALTVSLVRAGLMSFPQALGVVLGANLGTTATSFLIGLEIQRYALPVLAAGSFLILFAPPKRLKRLGGVLLGFGMIFYGLDLMGEALSVFVEFEFFRNSLEFVSEVPLLGVFVGAILTAIAHSSTAVIGILQQLYTTGAMPLIGAIAIVLGSNIGTTITAILAALGGSTAAKRTAAAHVIFNVGGSVIFLILIAPYALFIGWLQDVFYAGRPSAMVVSFAHIFFNLFNTIIMYFLISRLAALSEKIIKSKTTDITVDTDALQESLIKNSPALALENAKHVIMSMGDVAQMMYDTAVEYSFHNDKKRLEKGRELEELIDTIDTRVHDYLVKLSHHLLDDDWADDQAAYVDTIRDIERIADHCQNLFDFFEHRHETKKRLSDDSEKELRNLYKLTKETLTLTLQAFKDNDPDTASKIPDFEESIDNLVRNARKAHVQRCNLPASDCDDLLFVDILSNVERIGDHCENIALNILHKRRHFEKTQPAKT